MRTNRGIGIALLAAALLTAPGFAQNEQRRVLAMQKDPPYLGIGVQDVDGDRAKALKLKEERGAEITTVYPDSPAAKAGLKAGDVVLDFNGTAVQGMAHLQRLVGDTPAGHTAKMTIWRNGAAQTITAMIGQRKGMWLETPDGVTTITGPETPMPPMPPMAMPRMITIMPSGMLGIDGEPLNEEPQFAEFMGAKDGVLVKSVNRNSAAEKAGIKAGDVIVKVDDTHVSSSGDITRALRAAHGKKNFTLSIVRNKKEMTLAVDLGER